MYGVWDIAADICRSTMFGVEWVINNVEAGDLETVGRVHVDVCQLMTSTYSATMMAHYYSTLGLSYRGDYALFKVHMNFS